MNYYALLIAELLGFSSDIILYQRRYFFNRELAISVADTSRVVRIAFFTDTL